MRIGIVSTYPPRQCGIATFSADLADALRTTTGVDGVDVVAMSRGESYSPPVISTIDAEVRCDYVAGAQALEDHGVDVVIVQHEFGIFGGRDGELLAELTEQLALPHVITLHTVLTEPTPSQAAVLRRVCRRAAGVMVFTETARRLVTASGVADPSRVHVVPHGAPRPICDVADTSRVSGRSDRFVLSSFGLISPGKGIEDIIDALAKVVPSHPDVMLVVAGRTHPEVAKRHGENYRHQLEQRVSELDLRDHVRFDDRFLAIEELADLMARTDLYVTAYPSAEQIVSGSLTFALAAGRPVVSTPYLYAAEMLRSGAGRLVPFDDPAALATAIVELIDEPDLLARCAAEARSVGATLDWASVATTTVGLLRPMVGTRPPGEAAER